MALVETTFSDQNILKIKTVIKLDKVAQTIHLKSSKLLTLLFNFYKLQHTIILETTYQNLLMRIHPIPRGKIFLFVKIMIRKTENN